jgi:hypothetical protein
VGWPIDAGVGPNTSDSGIRVTKASTPEARDVVRQPNVSKHHTSTGALRPPTAKPDWEMASAVARLRSNHCTVAVTTVRKPDSEAPMAAMR